MNSKLYPFHLFESMRKIDKENIFNGSQINNKHPFNLRAHTLAGRISTEHTKARGMMPIAATKIMNDKLITGTYEYADKS